MRSADMNEFDDVLNQIDENIKSKRLTDSEQLLSKLEESQQLWEMSNRRKNQTGLPVNIYVDENGSYRKGGHGKRIKFQLNHGDKMQNQPFAEMMLDGSVVEETFRKNKDIKIEIDKKDIKQVSNYVKNNAYALDKVADEEIFMEDYDKVAINGGKEADNEQKEKQKKAVDEIIKQRS